MFCLWKWRIKGVGYTDSDIMSDIDNQKLTASNIFLCNGGASVLGTVPTGWFGVYRTRPAPNRHGLAIFLAQILDCTKLIQPIPEPD